jgi:AcrR family transcriptional regulator
MSVMGHREDLLQGAKRSLYERGYARTTARDIVAASGTNLGSIGYHYGSTQALMTAAMMSAMEEWGETLADALVADTSDESDDPLVRFWRRVIRTVDSHRELWMASIEAMIQGDYQPELRKLIADGMEQGRSGMAAMITGTPEDQLDEATIRSVGSAQMALISGVMIQWLVNPATAPSAEQIVAGIRAIAAV